MSKESMKNVILDSANKTRQKIEESIKLEKAQRDALERKKFEYATAVILELLAMNREREQGLLFYEIDHLFREQDGEDIDMTTGQMQLILNTLTAANYIRCLKHSDNPQKSSFTYNL